MKFDSSLAWKRASASIQANREVGLALAGVFYLLPTLALGLFFPQPEPAGDLGREEMMGLLSEYYVSIAPIAIPMILFQAVGTLALLTLLTDRRRPTVGEAIKLGVKGIIPYMLAQLIFGLAFGLVGGIILAGTGATGVAAIVAIGFLAVLLIGLYGFIKTSLVAPAIVVDGKINPIEALKRSWTLTRGNSLRIGAFFVLVAIAFLVVILVITALLGILLNVTLGKEGGDLAMLVISSAMNAAVALYFVAIIAAIHAQLADNSAETIGRTFD